MGVYLRDIVYDDLRDVAPVSAVTKGDVATVGNVVGFYALDYDPTLDTSVTFIYQAKQAEAPKAVGTGEGISTGAKLYWDASGLVVTTTAGGNTLCAIAKETVSDTATTILVQWDGTLGIVS